MLSLGNVKQICPKEMALSEHIYNTFPDIDLLIQPSTEEKQKQFIQMVLNGVHIQENGQQAIDNQQPLTKAEEQFGETLETELSNTRSELPTIEDTDDIDAMFEKLL